MFVTSSLTPPVRKGIMVTGLLSGAFWAALGYLQPNAVLTLYLQVLLTGFAGVLAFTVTRFRSPAPWLQALVVLPFLALMTGWLCWHFADTDKGAFPDQIFVVAIFWLFLLLPLLQARSNPQQESYATAVVAALWQNSFTVTATVLLTGLFWLLLLFWSKLFSLIGIGLFDELFFRNSFFPPIATGTVIATGIALCRSLPAASAIFRRFLTLLATVTLPLFAAISLLFIAFLPFTGLSIIPKNVSAATLLSILALMMMVISAMVGTTGTSTLRYPNWIHKLVVVAQLLTPIFSLLAAYALGLRIAEYGWSMDRVNAAVAISVIVIWTLGAVWMLRHGWRDVVPQIDRLTTAILGLIALLWLLLHTPVIDPYRIAVNSQLSRLEQGQNRADYLDLYMFSSAGRRGNQALRTLQQHPQWLNKPAQLRSTLASMLTENGRDEASALTPETLRQHIHVRKGSRVPPESWWQSLPENSYAVRTCMAASSFCLAWSMDMNNDGIAEVLIYDRDQNKIDIFSIENGSWRTVAHISLRDSAQLTGKAIEDGKLNTVEKQWRDLQIDGNRYPVQYYGW
ncbi:DUF4153 domain-containing protein [Erwiniaceae bacterium BAC15a-03b]|uniref:DUF4153 domain-containing protein n=1 Tax=Winslowiella arboricola TaxID=2978220 RepID=A0A9J6PWK8_9GAMM|nr:DUF4153 domain-containing protein [Winslowiella arboricola]MCU5773710.1 DUF4153 domain-containing protein [Winslowiella arboricola]MCU5778391.1 DUF4153 domain-containing protein [Winslowiella arboricola]